MSELSSASILKISDAKTMQLINLYYNEECLWNTNIKAYKNKEKRRLATEKIATILDLPNFTAKHVVRKFKNLRNAYSQEQKKIAHSIAAGNQGANLYTPKVFWYSKLNSFIRPHIHEKKTIEEVQVYKPDLSSDEEMADQAVADPAELAGGPLSPNSEDGDPTCPKKRKLNPEPAKKTKREDKSVAESLKDIHSQLNVLLSGDSHEAFGRYVATLLRGMNPQKALALQPKIVELITRADQAELKNGGEASLPQWCGNNVQVKTDRDKSDLCLVNGSFIEVQRP